MTNFHVQHAEQNRKKLKIDLNYKTSGHGAKPT